jgi:hypothetical protein
LCGNRNTGGGPVNQARLEGGMAARPSEVVVDMAVVVVVDVVVVDDDPTWVGTTTGLARNLRCHDEETERRSRVLRWAVRFRGVGG